MSENEAKVVREQLARRGSDNPHSFKPIAGFRTCRICGLPRGHKVHDVKDSANMAPHSTQEQGATGRSDTSSDLTREKPLPPHPQARSTLFGQIRRCPRCRKLNTGTDLSCYWCGMELPADTPAPANIEPPSFAGYAKTGGIRRKSRLPVLGILAVVLLLAGAGTGLWMLRSSLPSKPATAPSSVVVTISPARP